MKVTHFYQILLNSLILTAFLHSSTEYNTLSLKDSTEDKTLFYYSKNFHHKDFYIFVLWEGFQIHPLAFPLPLKLSIWIWTASALLKQFSKLLPLTAFQFTLFSFSSKRSSPFRREEEVPEHTCCTPLMQPNLTLHIMQNTCHAHVRSSKSTPPFYRHPSSAPHTMLMS